MKIRFMVLCLLLSRSWTAVYAEQIDDRVARAAAIQEAEENNKLCQLGSPACKGGLPAGGIGLPSGPGAAGLPAMPTGMGALRSPAGIVADGGKNDAQIARPKATGLSVVGGERRVEVAYKGALVTLNEGDVLGGWSLAAISDNGVTWEKVKKATKSKRKTMPKREYDIFGAPALTNPVAVR